MVELQFHISKKVRKNCIKTLINEYDKKEHGRELYIKIEKGIYHFTRQYCESNFHYISMAEQIYNDTLDNICYNCNKNGETICSIRKSIKKNLFNPYNLAFLKPEELDESGWSKILFRINKTEETVNNLPTVNWEPCKSCKCVEHFYYQLQTRSSDEAMTIFYICKYCERKTAVNN